MPTSDKSGCHVTIPVARSTVRHGKAISTTVNTSALMTLHRNGLVTGGATGSWRLARDNDFTITLNDVKYRGVFTTQWDDDNGAWVYGFSALSSDGVAVWGSRTVVPRDPPARFG